MDTTQKEKNYGKTLTFRLPSGFDVTIREQNGNDDDILSKVSNLKDGSSMGKFLSAIIIEPKLSMETINNWKARDKYYAIFKSRVFSLGESVTFKHKCSNTNCGKETDWEEDLTQFDNDFMVEPLKPEDEGYKEPNKYQIQKYPNGDLPTHEINLSSGKKVRFTYKNGESERKLLDIKENDISKNTELLIRNLEFFDNLKWQKVQHFGLFNPKDMVEIRNNVKLFDSDWDAVAELNCPHCHNTDLISLVTQPTFFFPEEI